MARTRKPAFTSVLLVLLCAITMVVSCGPIAPRASAAGLNIEDFWIRDPNILYHNGTYYMTGTTEPWGGFLGYSSTDLVT